ncbi:MAG: hypothetical protein ACON4Z_18075 [Planctomycetota bacterium]
MRAPLASGVLCLAAALPGQQLPVVAAVAAGAEVLAMRSFSQGVTADARGHLWCLVYEHRAEGDVRRLWLHRSVDQGQTWRRVDRVPEDAAAYGAVTGARDASRLHVVYAARLAPAEHMSACYREFDVDAARWVGAVEVLQRATGPEDQFSVCDVARTDGGDVVALVSTHRRPQQPPWPSGWSSGLLIRSGDGAGWQGPHPIHTNRYGVWASLQVRDDAAHVSYRTSPAHSMIGYRSFDLTTRAFEQPADVEVSVRPASGRYVSNASALVVHPFGARTVAYPAAGRGGIGRPDNGRLLLAFSPDGERWTTSTLCDDPGLVAGNVPHEHFALALGPGAQAIALYSKVSEAHRVLYRRFVEGGVVRGREAVVARSERAGAFTRVAAVRDPRLVVSVEAIVSGQGDGAALGVRAVPAPRPVKTRWQ